MGEDEHTRGTRALESTIEAIAQEIRSFDSSEPPRSSGGPEELMRATRPITLATAKAVAAGKSCKQDDVIVAANMGRKAISCSSRTRCGRPIQGASAAGDACAEQADHGGKAEPAYSVEEDCPVCHGACTDCRASERCRLGRPGRSDADRGERASGCSSEHREGSQEARQLEAKEGARRQQCC